MELKCLSFSDLSLELLYEILALRQAVFIVEQDCPYLDADGMDQASLHCLGLSNGKLVAYTRLLSQGMTYADYAAIGRVITAAEARGTGAGKKIMQYSLECIAQHFPGQPIKISAQSHLDRFYSQLGFAAVGEGYLEDGIPHQAMIHRG